MVKRALRMLAAIVGATLALWLLSGDRDPDAAQRMESAIGTYPVPPAVKMDGHEYVLSCRVTQDDVYDFHGLAYFDFTCGDSGFNLSVDADLPLATVLKGYKGQRIYLAIGGRE